jgi:hypothetical protein
MATEYDAERSWILVAKMMSQGALSRTRALFQGESRDVNNPILVLLLRRVLLLSQQSIDV